MVNGHLLSSSHKKAPRGGAKILFSVGFNLNHHVFVIILSGQDTRVLLRKINR